MIPFSIPSLALFPIIWPPHRLQVGVMKTCGKFLWITKVKRGTWPNVVDLPSAPSVVVPRHASGELRFQVRDKFWQCASDKFLCLFGLLAMFENAVNPTAELPTNAEAWILLAAILDPLCLIWAQILLVLLAATLFSDCISMAVIVCQRAFCATRSASVFNLASISRAIFSQWLPRNTQGARFAFNAASIGVSRFFLFIRRLEPRLNPPLVVDPASMPFCKAPGLSVITKLRNWRSTSTLAWFRCFGSPRWHDLSPCISFRLTNT